MSETFEQGNRTPRMQFSCYATSLGRGLPSGEATPNRRSRAVSLERLRAIILFGASGSGEGNAETTGRGAGGRKTVPNKAVQFAHGPSGRGLEVGYLLYAPWTP